MRLDLVISGGQTGADRAALDWALRVGLPHGGWCPQGRLAADCPLAPRYQLRETESAGYRQRTKRNVTDSDATLIFNLGVLDGGTLQTVKFAKTACKPCLVVQLDEVTAPQAAQLITAWQRQGDYRCLNIAGPREEKRPGLYAAVMRVLDHCADGEDGGRHPEMP